jgi:hypothetical protein
MSIVCDGENFGLCLLLFSSTVLGLGDGGLVATIPKERR